MTDLVKSIALARPHPSIEHLPASTVATVPVAPKYCANSIPVFDKPLEWVAQGHEVIDAQPGGHSLGGFAGQVCENGAEEAAVPAGAQ